MKNSIQKQNRKAVFKSLLCLSLGIVAVGSPTNMEAAVSVTEQTASNDSAYVKFRENGDRAMRQRKYDEALANYTQALASAKNDKMRGEGNFYVAMSYLSQSKYVEAWSSINKAIELCPGDMRFYNLKYNVLMSMISETGGENQRLDINVLITTAIQTLTDGKSVCEQKGQEGAFEICEKNLEEARKRGHQFLFDAQQLTKAGVSVGQVYQMQSGDVKLSAVLTEY
jgi:tetratricopeptide (TPR) repeat protein